MRFRRQLSRIRLTAFDRLLGRDPQRLGPLPQALALGRHALVDHLRQPHRLQAVGAPHAGGELPQHHVPQGLVDRHPLVVAEDGRGFLAGQFGQQGVDEVLVLAEHAPSACR